MSSKNESRTTGPDPIWVVEAVRRMQDGQDAEEGFQPIFDQYFDFARRWLRRRGVSPQMAEDLAQDAMLRVYKGIGRFRWQSSFNTWTLHVVSNVYKNHLRHLDTARPSTESESLDSLLEDEAVGERALLPKNVASKDPDPQEAALAAERKRHLSTALDELPSRIRQCVLLRFQGLKYREIACLLGVQVDTVKKQLAEGRRRLRPILGSVPFLGSVGSLFTTLWSLWFVITVVRQLTE